MGSSLQQDGVLRQDSSAPREGHLESTKCATPVEKLRQAKTKGGTVPEHKVSDRLAKSLAMLSTKLEKGRERRALLARTAPWPSTTCASIRDAKIKDGTMAPALPLHVRISVAVRAISGERETPYQLESRCRCRRYLEEPTAATSISRGPRYRASTPSRPKTKRAGRGLRSDPDGKNKNTKTPSHEGHSAPRVAVDVRRLHGDDHDARRPPLDDVGGRRPSLRRGAA
ncbi:hypothetical protein THAOC_36816, partial [Thalassiosira oceanica]